MHEAEREACEIKARAEIRTGELLKELARVTNADAGAIGGNTKAGNVAPPAKGAASPYAQALTDNNISSQSASRYQALCRLCCR